MVLFNWPNQRLGVLERQALDDFQLQRLTQEMRLLRKTDVDPADDGGILRKHFDQSLFLKPHQRIADRRRADAELPGQRVARQGRSRGSASEVISLRNCSKTCGAPAGRGSSGAWDRPANGVKGPARTHSDGKPRCRSNFPKAPS